MDRKEADSFLAYATQEINYRCSASALAKKGYVAESNALAANIVLGLKATLNVFVLLESTATMELVDNHHGIYAMHSLACRHALYDKDGAVQGSLDLKKRFHPDNPEWVKETLEDFYVKQMDGSLWRCEWWEGDILAVNPKARWSEKENCWTLTSKKVAGTCPTCCQDYFEED